ncbi:MAG: NAD-dependent epimerase/dehydratase family protein [Chloroflexi bacterium]|nr:NAD-dependent epimerase/dehydratase family protein [Chloroflexota bacterium]
MILITGAAGHIGNVLARELFRRGKKVRALVLPGEDVSPLSDSNPEIVEANILDYPALKAAMEGIDVVFHLASLVAIVPEQNELMRNVNIEGTRNVIQACREVGVRRLIYTSSIHAYGHPDLSVVIDESLPFDTEVGGGGYDRTKAEASKLVVDAARNGLNTVLLAPTGVIGPYDFKRSEMGEMTNYWMKPSPTFSTDGAYDFVDVRDVVDAHIQAITAGEAGEAFILPGNRVTVREYRKLVQKASQVNGREVYIPFKLAWLFAPAAEWYYRLSKTRPRFTRYSLNTLQSNSVISGKKASNVLGFHPRPMMETIGDSVRWWREYGSALKPSLRTVPAVKQPV